MPPSKKKFLILEVEHFPLSALAFISIIKQFLKYKKVCETIEKEEMKKEIEEKMDFEIESSIDGQAQHKSIE